MTIYKNNDLNFFSKYPIVISAIISLIVLAIFAGVLTADFVMWDDDITVYENHYIGRLSFERICWAFTDVDSTMRYIPLTLLSWISTYNLWELNPLGYHLLNWLLHGLSSGLLFLIIRKILLLSFKVTNDNREVHLQINIVAVLTTLFWALHPLRVEPVAWVTDLAYCQAVFFILFSTLCYIEAVASISEKKRYFYLIVLAFILYALSLLSHPMGITYFAVFLILDIFLFKRIGGAIGWWKSKSAKKVIDEKFIFAIPAILIGIISVIVRVQSAGVWRPAVPLSAFGLFDRIMQAVYILSYYIWRPFYPVDFAPTYTTLISFNPLSMPFILSALFVITASILLFIFRRRWPLILALWLSYIILLIPFMGFFEHPHYHCDRYSLMPSICFSILIAFGLIKLVINKYLSVISVSALLIVISILGLLSYNQIKIWYNSESLLSHTIETLGNNPYRQDSYWRLGKYFYEKGERGKAIMYFENTLAINPFHPIALTYLAKILNENDFLIKSIYHLQNFLINNPTNIKAHYRLSYLFNELNKKKEAAYYFERAVDLQRLKNSAVQNSKITRPEAQPNKLFH
ncbi:MAG: hypothetical protein JW976_03060 [Syntrophaceae bacterium]|nr:hypothetical protein [Syntrophaceae bacterium]